MSGHDVLVVLPTELCSCNDSVLIVTVNMLQLTVRAGAAVFL